VPVALVSCDGPGFAIERGTEVAPRRERSSRTRAPRCRARRDPRDVELEELDVTDHLIEIRETTGGKVVDDPDVMSGGEQTADDVRSDEACAAVTSARTLLSPR